MAHVIRVTIEGLAGSRKAYSFTLNRDVNIFFGENGSGKTSLLKILHSAMSGDTTILNNVSFGRAEVTIFSISANKELTFTCEKTSREEQSHETYFSFDPDLPLHIRSEIAQQMMQNRPRLKHKWVLKPKDKTYTTTRWQHVYLPTSRLYVTSYAHVYRAQPSPGEVLSEEQLDQFYAGFLQELWSRYYYEIQRLVQKAQQDGLANILKSVLSPQSPKARDANPLDAATAYQRAAAFLKRQGSPSIIGRQANFEKHYEDSPQLRNVVSDINEVEEKIEAAMAPQKTFERLVSNMFSNDKKLIIKDKEVIVLTRDNQPIQLTLLSSGEKHLLRLFIEALNARESSAIIDEPEISLHIDWQRTLIASMRQLNPSAQYILATHSPEIMADIRDEKIFKL